MVSKILKAIQSTQQQYPNSLQQAVGAVKKALGWLDRQPFGNEVKELFKRVSFKVDLGNFPELGVGKFGISKNSGETTLYASTERNSRFPMSIDGFVRSAQKKASEKRGDATAKAAAAKLAAENARKAADEAQRLSIEAARAMELAEAAANTFESAIAGFAAARR
jgi:hypothetical protein